MNRTNVVWVIISLSFISFMGSCQTVSEIKFSTSTRGYNKEIMLTPKTITFHELNSREPDKEKKVTWQLKKSDWKRVLQTLDGVMLNEIPLLKAPSSKRNFDGARASTLSITGKNGKTWNHDFDDESPNAVLAALMEVITELTVGK